MTRLFPSLSVTGDSLNRTAKRINHRYGSTNRTVHQPTGERVMFGHIQLLLLLVPFASGWPQRIVQSGQQCRIETNQGEQPSVFVPAAECTTYRERSKNRSLADQSIVCCPVFQSDPAHCGRLSQNAGVFSFDSREVLLDQFPWAAVILYHHNRSVLCSGSLITNHHVLTAAHCFLTSVSDKNASHYRVRLGDWDLVQDDDCMYVRGQLECNRQQPIERLVAGIIKHADFKHASRDILHDIALVRLVQPVEYGAQIGPACLPPWSTRVPEVGGRNFTAIGWGRTKAFGTVKRKMKIDIRGRNVSACVVAYGLQSPEVPLIHLCAGGAYRKDLCYGDSGGSLMYREPDRWVQVGIVSFGAYNCGTPLPGVYTNVAYYIDWIQWAVEQLGS
uniref:Peptidase S1 domain-containing protein n=1 Tax=Anopheles farauti TaxID=69004 RepID=A0A182Q1B6_9DIPT